MLVSACAGSAERTEVPMPAPEPAATAVNDHQTPNSDAATRRGAIPKPSALSEPLLVADPIVADAEPQPTAVRRTPPTKAATIEPSAEDVQRAGQLVAQGRQLYRDGKYDDAEKALSKAMALFPFDSAANLLLGKVLLIKGSANRDFGLVNNARLFFEMAAALDPNNNETTVLLRLFGKQQP